MYIKQPHNYKSFVTPFEQRLLQYGVDDSKIYLSRAANDVFQVFTNGYPSTDLTSRPYNDRRHAIIEGGRIETTLDGTSLIRITLSESIIIADSTLLIFPEPTTVDINVETLDDDGELLVFCNYKYTETVHENKPLIKVLYRNNSTFTPDEFDPIRDLMILTKINFIKTGSVVTNLISSITNPFIRINKEFILISGYEYEVAPLPNYWYSILNTLENIYSKKDKFSISNFSLWSVDFAFDSSGEVYSTLLNLNTVNCLTPIVQCYIQNFVIVPTSIQIINSTTVKILMPRSWVEQHQILDIIIIG